MSLFPDMNRVALQSPAPGGAAVPRPIVAVIDDDVAVDKSFGQMLQAAGSGGPQFLSTHPSPENRLADLRVYADRVMPLYQQARR